MIRTVYTLVYGLLMPIILLRMLWRSRLAPAYRERMLERFGIFDSPERTGGLWIHAVSVGEILAVMPLIQRVLDEHPDLNITVTTTTPTGSEQVRNQLGNDVFHVYFPYDLPFAVQGFLDRVKPDHLLMVETEIWPNLLAKCAEQGVSTLLANARLSAKSAKGYARFKSLTEATFSRINCVAAQTKDDAKRFLDLGVPEANVQVTGSIKFDKRIPASVEEHAEVIRREWAGRSVWIAASTHEGEEEQVLGAHKLVLEQLPDTLLVIVPRHPERFDKVAGLVKRSGLELARRSANEAISADTQVYLGDTMGELPVLLGASDAAFFGGSLVPTGGHNMLEAAAQGVPVCFGPHVFNFSAISALLIQEHAAMQVIDAEGLGRLMADWLSDASKRSAFGEQGRDVVAANGGALDRLIALLPV